MTIDILPRQHRSYGPTTFLFDPQYRLLLLRPGLLKRYYSQPRQVMITKVFVSKEMDLRLNPILCRTTCKSSGLPSSGTN